jgi:hypothetical protein
MTHLTKHKSTAYRAIEEGLLDLSAVNEGLITIERDGTFKDTEKLTALLTALDARAATRRAELRAKGGAAADEGLDIQLDEALSSYRAASTDYYAASLALEACAKMLPLASDAHLGSLVDALEEQMETSSDYLAATAGGIERLLGASPGAERQQ